MGLKEEAKALAQEIIAEQLWLSRLSWSLEQDLQKIRLAEVGASGIQHRVCLPLDDLYAQLQETMDRVRRER